MSREIRHENYRVEVEVSMWSHVRERHESAVEACRAVVKQIARHCDDIDSARPVFDTFHACSHCGGRWTSDHPTYNGCCQRDLDDAVAAGLADINGNMIATESAP